MRLLAILTLLALAACGEAPKPPEKLAGPVPARVCSEVTKALDALSRQAGIDYDNQGGATVEEQAWLAMASDQRDSLVRALAFHASCTAGRQEEARQVTVRNETGMAVTRRTVSTLADMTQQLGQGQDRPGGE